MSLDDIKKIIEEKKPNVEEAYKLIQGEIKKIPDYAKKFNDMNLARGHIIGTAIKIESVLNEIIARTNNPTMAKSTLQKKVGFIRRILRRINQDDQTLNMFYQKLDQFVKLRGLFAHVPEDIFSDPLKFEQGENYEGFLIGYEGKTIKELYQEFLETCTFITKEYEKIMSLIKTHLDKENPINVTDSMLGRINPKKALCYLVLGRDPQGHINSEEKYKGLCPQDIETLKIKSNLKDYSKRFYQCFENPKSKHFLKEIKISEIYNEYFNTPSDIWRKDYLINFANDFLTNEKVNSIDDTSKCTPIFVIKIKDDQKYRILDGIHRVIAFVRDNKTSIKAVVVIAEEEIEEA